MAEAPPKRRIVADLYLIQRTNRQYRSMLNIAQGQAERWAGEAAVLRPVFYAAEMALRDPVDTSILADAVADYGAWSRSYASGAREETTLAGAEIERRLLLARLAHLDAELARSQGVNVPMPETGEESHQ